LQDLMVIRAEAMPALPQQQVLIAEKLKIASSA
jgi:hypothetical protein